LIIFNFRALCELQLNEYQLAREDAEDAIELDFKQVNVIFPNNKFTIVSCQSTTYFFVRNNLLMANRNLNHSISEYFIGQVLSDFVRDRFQPVALQRSVECLRSWWVSWFNIFSFIGELKFSFRSSTLNCSVFFLNFKKLNLGLGYLAGYWWRRYLPMPMPSTKHCLPSGFC
jgi:hypothetical protein